MKNILKVQNKGDFAVSGKHVGVMMPRQVTDYLSLYALAQKGTKSIIIRTLIDDWYIEQRRECTEDDLIDQIAEHVFEVWKKVRSQTPRIPFVEFGRDLKRDLHQKGINEVSTNLIIKKVADEAEKETS